MANPDIGRVDCPVCDSDAALRDTKKGKCYVMCDECGFQGFARGVRADSFLRGKARGLVSTQGAGFAAGHNPAKSVQAEIEPEKAPDLGRRKVVHTSDGETTIFDVLGGLLKS